MHKCVEHIIGKAEPRNKRRIRDRENKFNNEYSDPLLGISVTFVVYLSTNNLSTPNIY